MPFYFCLMLKTHIMSNLKQRNATSIQKVVYSYNGNPIQFVANGKLTINATEMAKPFGKQKQPVHWLNNQSTNEFLKELSKLRNISLADLVRVNRGGANPGTWFHEDVALEFARWLSPAFAIWCNDRIKEMLLGNYVMVEKEPDINLDASKILKQFEEQASRLAPDAFKLIAITSFLDRKSVV